jgi:hypothetical protein
MRSRNEQAKEKMETGLRLKEDQDRDPWSVLDDLYTRKARFKAELELSTSLQTLVHRS